MKFNILVTRFAIIKIPNRKMILHDVPKIVYGTKFAYLFIVIEQRIA